MKDRQTLTKYDGYLLLKKLKLYGKFYKLSRDQHALRGVVIFIVNNKVKHAGLVDRLKALIAAYFIAKKNNLDFKVVHNSPFELQDYLIPNTQDWRLMESEISYSLWSSKIINAYGMVAPEGLNINKQYHLYTSRDIIRTYYPVPERFRVWGELFNELFKPSDKLSTAIESVQLVPNSYLAIHLRFVNALEYFEAGVDNSLDDIRKEELILRCRLKVLEITQENRNMKTVVFSDSALFLERIRDIENVIVLDGRLGHVTFAGQDDEVTSKVFLDFYLLSRAAKVYNITADEMYETMFSAYAAHAGFKEFVRLKV